MAEALLRTILTPGADQAGVIPYRIQGGRLEVMLITRTTGGWGVPKGTIEIGEHARAAACREAWEEAGLDGLAGGSPIAWYRGRKRGRPMLVALFPLSVSSAGRTWPEAHRRRRAWFDPRVAAAAVRDPLLAGPLLSLILHRRHLAELTIRAALSMLPAELAA